LDVVGSEAVRLRQGDFDEVVSRAGDAGELMRRFAAARPPFIHLVDLDGARSGRIRPELVGRLAATAAPTPVQASGGVRSLGDAQALLDSGAARVVVGTAALESPDTLAELAGAFDERVVAAVDARARGAWPLQAGAV
jgi:phosphoribosylformimino-5-aminoimidazole carboxamide ribotide isomerase